MLPHRERRGPGWYTLGVKRRSPSASLLALVATLFTAAPAVQAQVLVPDTGGVRIGDREVPASEDEAAKRLAELMPRWAATARRYETYALRFVCTETHRTIDYSRSAGEARSEKSTPYGYLLTLDQKNASFQVVRQTLDEERRPTGHERALDLPCPEPYMWTFLFLPTFSSAMRFHYLGREIQNFRLSHVVSFEGSAARVDGRDMREWTGTVWVEENTGNIVRVEARPSFQNDRMLALWREFQQAFGLPLGFKTRSRPHGYVLSVLFDDERDGLLFPSRLDLTDFVWIALQREAMDTRLELVYDDYRFFRTEAEEEIQSPPPPKK